MLKQTPLYSEHVALGARIVDFGGFAMPLKYTSESAEHMTVRTQVGLFDVSHMGEVRIQGKGAIGLVQKLLTNDAAAIIDGQAMYAGMLYENGTFVDDVIAYRFNEEHFLICVNAGNRDKDFAWMSEQTKRYNEEHHTSVKITDEGELWGQIAVQGPKAVDLVARLAGDGCRSIGGYHFAEMEITMDSPDVTTKAIVARTGYTGEDGFELYVAADATASVWRALLKHGADLDVKPCGLACRDTLRLEAGMSLYGNDIDAEHTPIEANLGWIVKLTKKDGSTFIGHDVLAAQKAAGPSKILRGILVEERAILRHGYSVYANTDDATAIGVITSGTQTPFLNKAIAMGYVAASHAAIGSRIFVDVRGRRVPAQVSKLPFYRRQK